MLTVNFDSAIYNAQAVKRAIKDFKNLADFSLKIRKNCIAVGITNIKNKDLEPVFAQEFSNYVLSLVGALK